MCARKVACHTAAVISGVKQCGASTQVKKQLAGSAASMLLAASVAVALAGAARSFYGAWFGALESIIALAAACAAYSLYYVACFAFEIRGPEVLSVCWNRHVVRDAKAACRALYGKPFDFDDAHYEEYMLQDEKEVDLNYFDRFLARKLSFLCWPSSCFAPELAQELLEQGIGKDDVLLDVGAGLGLAMLTFHHMLPCQRLHGIEASRQLFDVCRANLELVGSARMKVEFGDATKFDIPDDVTFIYMYNSFQDKLGCSAEDQHALFIAQLQASLRRSPRKLTFLLYDCDDEDGEENTRDPYDDAFVLLKSGKAGPDVFCCYDCSRQKDCSNEKDGSE